MSVMIRGLGEGSISAGAVTTMHAHRITDQTSQLDITLSSGIQIVLDKAAIRQLIGIHMELLSVTQYEPSIGLDGKLG